MCLLNGHIRTKVSNYVLGGCSFPSLLIDIYPRQVVRVLTVQSLDHTLVELNKIVALAGLTGIGLAAYRGSGSYNLLWWSSAFLIVHSAYSTYRYYGRGNHVPPIETFVTIGQDLVNKRTRPVGVKKLSVLLGIGLNAHTDTRTHAHTHTHIYI